METLIMRYLLTAVLVLAMAGIGFASVFGGSGSVFGGGYPASVTAVENSNAVYINDSRNPETAYDALIARTDMGTLSATNRRTLVLMPGTYTLTGTWELDTDYVDVVSLSGNPKDTVVYTNATSVNAVELTCRDTQIRGFTIRAGTAAGFGLYVNNTLSFTGCTSATTVVTKAGIGTNAANADYVRFKFDKDMTPNTIRKSRKISCDKLFVAGDGTSGTWYNILSSETDGSAVTVDGTVGTHTGLFCELVPMQTYFENMIFRGNADDLSYPSGTDTQAGVIAAYHLGGVWINCVSGHGSWRVNKVTSGLGLTSVADSGGYAQFTTDSPHKLAVGNTVWFADCGSYSGYTGATRKWVTAVAASTFTINTDYAAVDVSAGTYIQLDSDTIGIFINCQSGSYALGGDKARFVDGYWEKCSAGEMSFGGCSAIGSPISGDMIDCTAGNRSFAVSSTISGYLKNCSGGGCCFSGLAQANNNASITGVLEDCVSSGLYGTSTSFAFSGFPGSGKTISGRLVRCRNTKVQSTFDGGNSGAGAWATFSGTVIDCAGYSPKEVTDATTVREFDNGLTYINTGDTDSLTFTLCAAYPGLGYTFIDTEGDATEDVIVNPTDTDIIILDGVALSAGDSIIADNDEASDSPTEIVQLTCYKAGTWVAKTLAGTWDDNN
jgi:hypothetical protein